MAGDKLNTQGGSFLPKDDDFFQPNRAAAEARAKKSASVPGPTPAGIPGTPRAAAPAAEEAVEEEPSAQLGRSTEPPKGPMGATPTLQTGLNGIKEMQGGLPEMFKKEAAILGMEITEDDVMAYIMQGTISKVVPVVKDLLHARIRTLTSEEVSDINLRMSKELQERPDMIQKEYANRNTMLMFAYAIEALGKPGKVNTLPKEFDARLKQIRGLAPQIVAKLTHRYNLLEFLIQDRISDENFLKN